VSTVWRALVATNTSSEERPRRDQVRKAWNPDKERMAQGERPEAISMVKVECDGCRAPYQIDDNRVPPAGLMMRCPKCGTNILGKRPGAAPLRQHADLPVAVPVEKQKTAPHGIPRVLPPKAAPPPRAMGDEDDLVDLPIAAPAGRSSPAFGELDLD